MNDILFHYHKVNPTTWVYLSSLLTVALYFKFSRLWSVRNLDLVGLILLAPGLLMQKITTKEPEPAMIEVAIKSLQSVLEREASHEQDG